METSVRKTNAYYGKSPIDQMRIVKKEGDWTIEEANEFTQSITNAFFDTLQTQNKQVKLQLVYYFRDTNFFVSSRFFGKETRFVEPSLDNYDFDETLFTNVDMILINRVVLEAEGGNDTKNDCLWKALKISLGSHLKILPTTLKKHLKLPRNSKIHYKLIPKLEDKVKANINVVGDYTLQSTNNYPHNCYVELKAGHYTYTPNHKVYDVLYSQPSNKDLLVYESKNNTHITYNGMEIKEVEKKGFIQYCKENNYSAVKRNIFKYPKDYSLQNVYIDLVKQGDSLKKSSENLIDVKKNGYDFVKTAKNIFYNCCKSVEFENITAKEDDFLRNAKICGMMYCDKGKRANMKCYDFNQFYPYIISRTNTYKLPTGQPEIVSLTTLPDILSYGLYKVEIDIPTNNKFMIKNSHNVYTHYDIKIARELDYKITLLDGENACLYKKKRVYPSVLFKDYIDMLLKCKNDTNKKVVKRMMNCLWGALSQKNWITHDLRKPLVIDDLKQIRVRVNTTRDRVVADVIRKHTFKYAYSRIAPFITASGRYIMFKTIQPFYEKVYRIHTDGFYCDSSVKLETSEEIGKLKLEYEGECEFQHLNKKIEY